ncbi:MAG TPA: NAD(P)H-hydrate epimerase, partial [Candidatus Polarisedimenticolia bacterium]|nr:NAD(P)H-hydrate epimerase [Candidatus Polarisedimenticolia bacterium]
MKILSAQQMRSIDQRTSRDYGIPGIVLMENAGVQVVDFLESRYPDLEDRQLLLLCGKGNNGGDGLVASRHLHNRGYSIRLLLFGRRSEFRGEALTNLEILEKMGVEHLEVTDAREWHEFLPELGRYDLLVDAILGTGLKGPVKGYLEEIIRDINNASADRVAVDIPSGLSGDTNELPGLCIQADATVTFACPKVPHVFLPAEAKVG